MGRQTPLTVLSGIGSVRQAQLVERGIESVEALAEWTHAPSVWSKYVQLAKLFVQQKQGQQKGNTYLPEEKKRTIFRDVVYIETHSWWKQNIELLLPYQQTSQYRKRLRTFPAVMYEMCIEPDNRITILCQVYMHKSKKTKTVKFSPQFIINLNGNLPPLKLKLTPIEERMIFQMVHRQSFQNNLVETNILQHLARSVRDAAIDNDSQHSFDSWSATFSSSHVMQS